MKSPFTGGEATLHQELRTMEFRKEAFTITYHYYKCKDTGEQFTNDELDEVDLNQVYNQYREKYGIPFPDEIKAIREQYGLPANKMADVLGLGINVYRNYEAGEVPNISNGRLLQLVKDPNEFKRLLEYSSKEFTPEELTKINKKLDHALGEWDVFQHNYEIRLLGEKRPNQYNGYRVPHLEKAENMILFFAEKLKPFKTKMNKLLFYADFLHFSKTCYSISGLTYKAIQMGPVPKNYGGLYDQAMENQYVDTQIHDFGEYRGEQFVPTTQRIFKKELFSETEIETLRTVAEFFKQKTVSTIIEMSHEEEGWKKSVNEFNFISYLYSFELKYPTPGQPY
ncbi:MAG TPA: type II toxin-antitoxin system antitoxin SocA domain-containing protein [Puia sp.]|nr:type II toxin-antitoxin system antitoxin SocA domain-containing protein [Puia sp.]